MFRPERVILRLKKNYGKTQTTEIAIYKYLDKNFKIKIFSNFLVVVDLW